MPGGGTASWSTKRCSLYYTALPLPEFYEKVHTLLEPRLLGVQGKLDQTPLNLRRELEPHVKELVAAAFTGKTTGARS